MSGTATTATRRISNTWNVMGDDNVAVVGRYRAALLLILEHVRANTRIDSSHIRCTYISSIAEAALKENVPNENMPVV